ncbi:unnamed protein product [Clonostachys solani]|uniref:Aminoglycoside phosphotransferase domain-containing protein n=1 Tax=Clonostachys solani TaxID=160281 RepID=A0A9P0EIK2_9HYPO|nr:unnamed protein product [Clonostachys solani]
MDSAQMDSAPVDGNIVSLVQTYLDTSFRLEVRETRLSTRIRYGAAGITEFTYEIRLARPTPDRQWCEGGLQTGCEPMPGNMTKLMALVTWWEGAEPQRYGTAISQAASMNLASHALGSGRGPLVPDYYGYAQMGRYGIVLQQAMPGRRVSSVFHRMGNHQVDVLFHDIAGVLRRLQSWRLPDTVTGWGSVTLTDRGEIRSSTAPIRPRQPCTSLEDWLTCSALSRLQLADESRIIDGWRLYGLRNRILNYVRRGIPRLVQALENPDHRVLTHGSLSCTNLLCDERTGQLTAVLGTNRAIVTHPFQEFLSSFLVGSELTILPYDSGPLNLDGDSLRFYDDIFRRALDFHAVMTPRAIRGFRDAFAHQVLTVSILPGHLTQRCEFLGLVPEERRDGERDESAARLNRNLSELGF